MSKIRYGKNGQVVFYNEKEEEEAINYILTSSNVEMVHENNQDQGAWASEERIHFKNGDDIPECLKRNMTAGNGSLYGRINCKEFCDKINEIKNQRLND